MSIWRVAFRNIRGNTAKSLTIFLCVFGVAALFVSMTLVIGGARNSLNSGLERLGADIIVVPQGTDNGVETAFLLGKPTTAWMPASNLDTVAAVSGVGQASPQLYLQSLAGAPCCAVSEMFLVVYDPSTDFTIKPWLIQNLSGNLKTGDVIGGTYISTMGEPDLKLYGYHLQLVGNLQPTGMGIDQTLFMDMATAQAVAASSLTTAVSPLVIPQDQISSIMVKVTPGENVHAVAQAIMAAVPGVDAIESPNLFGAFRSQILGLLSGLDMLSILAWLIAAVVIGLVFSMATNERRREIAVLRGMGFKRGYIFRSLWLEAILLAAAASLAGVALTAFVIDYFHNYIAVTLGMPFLFPSMGSFMLVVAETLLISLITVSAGVFLPAYRASQQEPALAMRE